MSQLLTEISALDAISTAARALAEFSEAISIGSKFVSEGPRFVLRPANFVTFSVHHKRANNLTVSVRGNETEFEKRPELLLKKDQNGYSTFKFEKAEQLEAAAYYIKRAFDLYERGRTRDQKTPRTVEL
jgi:hypothetical protein